MPAQPPFHVPYASIQLDTGLISGQSYIAQVVGNGDIQYTNAADRDAAEAASWKICQRLEFFQFTVDASDPVWVRALNRTSSLSISDG